MNNQIIISQIAWIYSLKVWDALGNIESRPYWIFIQEILYNCHNSLVGDFFLSNNVIFDKSSSNNLLL